jgi:hypothetical protein
MIEEGRKKTKKEERRDRKNRIKAINKKLYWGNRLKTNTSDAVLAKFYSLFSSVCLNKLHYTTSNCRSQCPCGL